MRTSRYIRSALTALIVFTFALVLSTCGRQPDGLVNLQAADNPPIEVSFDAALAELVGLETPEGVDLALFQQLKDELAKQLRGKSVSKVACKPPMGEANKVTDLALVDNGDGTYTLQWSYRNSGDYDQNGTVGISDITPIAMQFGRTYEAADENCIQAVVDGSGNQAVDIADVTPIAMNFAVDCAGYRIQGGSSPEGSFTTVQGVDIEDAVGVGRLSFSEPLPPTAFRYVRVVPCDNQGVEGEPSDAVLVPGEPPEIASVTPLYGLEGESVAFSAEVNGTGPFAYAWDFDGGAEPNTSTQSNPSVILGAVGEYSASLTVSNAFGEDEFDFALAVNPAPPEIMSVSPIEGLESTSVQFSADVTGSEPLTYAWVFGGAADPNTSNETVPTVTLGEDGEYGAELTVSNMAGEDTLPFILTVEPGIPPDITDIQPLGGTTGQDVMFTATVSGTAPLSYSWSFGGGATPNTSSEELPEVTLGNQGVYSADLTITNLYGEDSFPFELEVTEPGWHLEIVDPDTQGWYNSLAFDPDGNPAISYFYSTDANLRFARWVNETWDIEDIDAGGCTAHDTSLAFDGDGFPCISYYNYGQRDLKVAWWDGSEWNVETIDFEGSVGAGNSLAMDENGNPAISYSDSTNHRVKLARWNGTGWVFETVATVADFAAETSLAFDHSWNPAVSYKDYNYAEPDLRFAWWHDGEWHDELLDSAGSVGSDSSLDFDHEGKPVISYGNWSNHDLKLARWNGTTWDVQTVEDAEWVEGQTSLAIDDSGYPVVCYHILNMNQLMIARWTGAAWDKVAIDVGASSQGYCSLVFDPDGNPVVAYARDPVLKLARWH